MSITLSPELRAIVETCVYCPKLCRWACPVAEAEARETVTPWGLMTLLDDVSRGDPLDESAAEVWAHCTGCGRCQDACKHDNDVPSAVAFARSEAVDAGVSPDAWRAWSESAPVRSTRVEGLPDAGPIRLLVGQAEGERLEAALALLDAAGYTALGRPGRCRSSGHRALAAGRPVAFAVAAESLSLALDGVETVICLDAEDAETLRFTYAERGVWSGSPPRVLHLIEAVAGRLPELEPAQSGDVLYLDACRLGRGLAVVDAPREMLAQAIGGRIIEALTHGEQGGCCGAGWALPAVDAEAAADVARDAVTIAPDVPVIIAGACAAHVRSALAPRPVKAWAEVIAAALPAAMEGA